MAAKLNYLAIATFLILSLYFFFAIPTSSDTYWHLSVGREVAKTLKIPTQDNFVYGSNPTNYPSTEWLAGLIFYWTTISLGNFGMPFLRTILGLLTMFIFYKTLRLITQNNWLINSSCIVVGYVLGYRLFDRPESFSFVFMALINFIIFKYFIENRFSNLIFSLPIIFFLWINIHAYFFLGFAAIFILLFIAIFKRSAKDVQKILGIIALTTIVSLTRFHTIAQFLSTSGGIYKIHIGEFDTLWQRLMITDGYDMLGQTSLDIYIYFFITFIFLTCLTQMAIKWKSNTLNLLIGLLYFVFLLSPVKMIRMLTPSILISTPFLIFLLRESIKKYQNVTLYISNSILLGMGLILTISIINKDILGIRFFHSVIYKDQKTPVAVVNNSWTQIFPKRAEVIINNYLDSKRIFTVNYWGNYFIWKSPQAKVFSDSMIAYKTPQDWDAENSLIYGVGNWQENLEKYQIDAVINNQPNVFIQNNTPIYKLDNWKLVFVNDTFSIYAKDTAIKKLPVDLSKIHPELPDLQKFSKNDEKEAVSQLENLKQFDPKNAFARQQLVYYYFDHDLQRAKELTMESKNLLPKNPYFSLYMAKISASENQCSQAKEFANETEQKSFGDFFINLEIQKINQQCPNW